MIETLFKNVSLSLNPGGRLILSTFLLETDRTSPIFSVKFALEMLVLTPTGRAYTMEEITSLLLRSGFTDIERLSGFRGPATFILASKERY